MPDTIPSLFLRSFSIFGITFLEWSQKNPVLQMIIQAELRLTQVRGSRPLVLPTAPARANSLCRSFGKDLGLL